MHPILFFKYGCDISFQVSKDWEVGLNSSRWFFLFLPKIMDRVALLRTPGDALKTFLEEKKRPYPTIPFSLL